jgi:hypothetical protein
MRVELSVNEDLEIPPAAKQLGEEVRTVQAWLDSSELFGTPNLLDDEAPQAIAAPEPVSIVDDVVGVPVAVGESEKVGENVGVAEAQVGSCFRYVFPSLTPLPQRKGSVPKGPPKGSVQRSPSPKWPTASGGAKRRLPLFSDDKDDTPQWAKKVKPAKATTLISDGERSPSREIEERSPLPEIPVVGTSSAKRRRGKGVSAMAEMDSIPQEITKHGYPEGAFLLNSEIYVGVCWFVLRLHVALLTRHSTVE